MDTIIIQLDASRLRNRDLDIRYILPDLLVARSSGLLISDGYDYARGDGPAPCLLLFLRTSDAANALPGLLEVLKSERVLENDLSDVPVAVDDGRSFRVVHPADFSGKFFRHSR
jgi:hypothetical protein